MFFMIEYQPNSHAGFYTKLILIIVYYLSWPGAGAETSAFRLQLQLKVPAPAPQHWEQPSPQKSIFSLLTGQRGAVNVFELRHFYSTFLSKGKYKFATGFLPAFLIFFFFNLYSF